MKSTKTSFPNAILFVFDPTNENVLVPPYVDDVLIAFNRTCISVGTQAAVDGETEASLSFDDYVPVGLSRAFVGSILAPGGKVAVITAELERVLELDVTMGEVGLSIWVDDLYAPSHVAVRIEHQ